jgi:hypothetical protein
MNERIRELAQLAVEDAAKYCQRPFDITREENETFAMSFAELIVKECLKMADRNGAYAVMDDIIEHFGLE